MNLSSLEQFCFYSKLSSFNYKTKMKQISIESLKISKMISRSISLESSDQKLNWFQKIIKFLKDLLDKIWKAVSGFFSKLFGKQKAIQKKIQIAENDFNKLRQVAPDMRIKIPKCLVESDLSDRIRDIENSLNLNTFYDEFRDKRIIVLNRIIGGIKNPDDKLLQEIHDEIESDNGLEIVQNALKSFKAKRASEIQNILSKVPKIDTYDEVEITVRDLTKYYIIPFSQSKVSFETRQKWINDDIKDRKEWLDICLVVISKSSNFPIIQEYFTYVIQIYQTEIDSLKEKLDIWLKLINSAYDLDYYMADIKNAAIQIYNLND